jgi:hypothetical protein
LNFCANQRNQREITVEANYEENISRYESYCGYQLTIPKFPKNIPKTEFSAHELKSSSVSSVEFKLNRIICE